MVSTIQVTIGNSSPTPLFTGNVTSTKVVVTGSPVYIGNSSVSTSSGYPTDQPTEVVLERGETLYGISPNNNTHVYLLVIE